MKTILFQGDSITDAGRSADNDTMTGFGYATLVRAELEYEYPEQYLIYNRGIGGNRVVDLYARIKSDIINLRPDVMSILIGVNDVWREFGHDGVTTEKYYKIYSMLIEEIKEALPNIKIMILEPFLLKGIHTEKDWEIFYSEVMKRAKAAKRLAENYNLPFVTLQDKFEQAAKIKGNNYWLYDGVHPTLAGHELIKREWLKCYKGMI